LGVVVWWVHRCHDLTRPPGTNPSPLPAERRAPKSHKPKKAIGMTTKVRKNTKENRIHEISTNQFLHHKAVPKSRENQEPSAHLSGL
jgi:hypothetical protein